MPLPSPSRLPTPAPVTPHPTLSLAPSYTPSPTAWDYGNARRSVTDDGCGDESDNVGASAGILVGTGLGGLLLGILLMRSTVGVRGWEKKKKKKNSVTPVVSGEFEDEAAAEEQEAADDRDEGKGEEKDDFDEELRSPEGVGGIGGGGRVRSASTPC